MSGSPAFLSSSSAAAMSASETCGASNRLFGSGLYQQEPLGRTVLFTMSTSICSAKPRRQGMNRRSEPSGIQR